MANHRQEQSQRTNDSSNDANNPVGNFFHWLTTPLEMDLTGETKASFEKNYSGSDQTRSFSKREEHRQTSLSPSTRTTQKSPKRQSPQKLKEFGELVSIHTPNQSNTPSSIHRASLSDNHNEPATLSPKHPQSRLLLPQLPSHVPTPETIESNDDHWSSGNHHALGGIHHHLQTMIFAGDKDREDDDEYHREIDIKYAPSLITPPESPVATSNRKTLKIDTPLSHSEHSTKSTRWGPDFWKLKKMERDLRSTRSSSERTIDTSNASVLDRTNHVAHVAASLPPPPPFTKRPASPSLILGTEIVCKKKTPSSPEIQNHYNPSNKDSTNEKTHNQLLTVQSTPPPLQLQWIYDNESNIQASVCRDSIRLYDGDDNVDLTVTSDDSFDEQEQFSLLPRTPSLLALGMMNE